MEIANIGRIGDTSNTSCIMRGEQIRVYSLLTRFCLEEGCYVNREMTARRPLKFNIKDYPPTFPDPPENPINTKLREKCTKLLERNLEYRGKARRGQKVEPIKLPHGSLNNRMDWLDQHPGQPFLGEDVDYDAIPGLNDEEEQDEKVQQDKQAYWKVINSLDNDAMDVDSDNEDEEMELTREGQPGSQEEKGSEEKEPEKEGGNVVKPAPGLWFGKDKKLDIFDFASLYPSIMEAYRVCYRNLLYDKQYLNLPGIPYIWVAINKYETTPLVQLPGIFDKLLKKLVEERGKVKKKMKIETDKFKKTMMENEQNSLKVYANGSYGFW
jgi:hypothetical protein